MTCTVCAHENVAFGDAWCPNCKAKVVYDFDGGQTYQRALGSIYIVKMARYGFLGMIGLFLIILGINVVTGETERAIVMLMPIVLVAICVMGLFWFTHYLANSFISRHAIKFVKE